MILWHKHFSRSSSYLIFKSSEMSNPAFLEAEQANDHKVDSYVRILSWQGHAGSAVFSLGRTNPNCNQEKNDLPSHTLEVT